MVEQVIRCLLPELTETRDWDSMLPHVAFIINSTPAVATGYSPFYLNFGYHPTTPLELLRDRDTSLNETVEQFIKRMQSDFQKAREQMHTAQQRMKKYADQRRLDVTYQPGQWVLLSTTHLSAKNIPRKFHVRILH